MNRGFDITEIRFAYGDKTVIEHMDLRLDMGRFIGIIGPNGCGKSTFLDLLAGNLAPGEGAIRLNDKKLSAYSRRQMALEVALVPQNFYINFPFTADEIVMMGRYPHMPRFSRPSAADLATVEETMAMTATDGFTGRYVTELSGGERQRVVFARALVQETPILMLDEATSNLDVNHAISLLNIAARKVAKGMTVIAVMQDINLAAAFCDHLLFMKKGRAAAFGKTEKVLNRDIIKEVFDIDCKVSFEPYAGALQVVFKR